MNDESKNPWMGSRRQWQQLGEFSGSPTEFWTLLTQGVAQCLRAELAVLYVRTPSESGEETWHSLAHWPAVGADKLPGLAETVTAAELQQARIDGVLLCGATGRAWRVGLLALTADAGQRELMLVLHLGQIAVSDVEVRQWLSAFQCAPWLYEAGRNIRAGERDALRLAQAIELLGRVLDSESFDQAALSITNELAERFACETVSISWRAHYGLRLRAISHAEKIDRRSELSALIEEAGQEAVSQGCEVVWPGTGKVVTRSHEQYAKLQFPGHMFSLPLVSTQGHSGAVSLERKRMAFTAAEQWALRMMCDLLLPPLMALEERSRPLLRRLSDEIWRSVPARYKPASEEGRWFARGLGIVALLALAVPLPYFVDTGAIVKADTMAFVGAPFDGYLESNRSSLGATVKAGDELFALATRELSLERAGILADIAQYSRESEKRRAANQLPEMQIADAQASQSSARLKQVDYRLENALAKSPIDGVVVEGEPGKNLGGAVRRGDVVLKIAALSSLYVEVAVRERDLSRVAVDQGVRLTLLADTGATYSMRVARIVPAASVKDGENTFPARVEVLSTPPEWWRPGMSGVAKIHVGYRPVIWIVTHRLMDYLRLVLWF